MDNNIKVWDVVTGQCLHTLTGHTSLVGLLGYSPNIMVSAAADASLRIWDAETHELKHTLGSQGGAITCIQHDETKVVSGSDGTLKLWDARTGAHIRDLIIGTSSVWQLGFHGNLLVAASNRGGSTVFDVFDFGVNFKTAAVDDDTLDKLCRPPWERKDPLEPQTYQIDELDFDITSPWKTGTRFQSPETDRSRGDSLPRLAERRRSNRIANKGASSAPSRPPYSIEPPPRSRRTAMRTDPASPSPAGPSRGPRMIDMVGVSFSPIFDDDKGDEPMDALDDIF